MGVVAIDLGEHQQVSKLDFGRFGGVGRGRRQEWVADCTNLQKYLARRIDAVIGDASNVEGSYTSRCSRIRDDLEVDVEAAEQGGHRVCGGNDDVGSDEEGCRVGQNRVGQLVTSDEKASSGQDVGKDDRGEIQGHFCRLRRLHDLSLVVVRQKLRVVRQCGHAILLRPS